MARKEEKKAEVSFVETLVMGDSIKVPAQISNTGVNNGIIAGGDVFINQSPPPAPKAYVPVGPEHLTNEQRMILKKLVDEIVEMEAIAKKKPKNYGPVWKSVNTLCHASEYKLILQTDFPKAEKYLRMWLGRLSSSKTAQKKDPNWRKRRYSFIHTNCKQFGLEEKMRSFILRNYGVESLKDLSDAELTATYQAISRWKKSLA